MATTTISTTKPDGSPGDDHTINYETFGDPSHPTLLLVNGLGSQMINYEPDFCQLFVAAGYQVAVFDNRDVGLSSKTAGPPPDIVSLRDRFRAGGSVVDVPYTLRDMANDGFAVLDALGVQSAHIAGMSMGGMIVQRMALDHPGRVRSMTSIMSTTGNPAVGQATPEAAASLVDPAPHDREGYIEYTIANRAITAGTHFSADYWRQHAPKTYDRNFNPDGSAFQIAAVASDGDRTAALGTLSVPSLVIHGRLDPLIGLSGGEATAEAIRGAKLLVIDEMGHDMPPEIWDEMTSAIIELATDADQQAEKE